MLIRKLKQLIYNKVLTGKFFNYNNIAQFEATIYSPDGIISMNTQAKIMAMKNDSADSVGMLVSDNERLLKVIGISYDDVFVGKEKNYIHFKSTGNISIKGTEVDINCNSISITTNSINFNGILISKLETGELAINNNPIAVIGGTVDPVTNQIITSGQV